MDELLHDLSFVQFQEMSSTNKLNSLLCHKCLAAINGYMYGNLPGLDMCLGDNVSWHVLSVGSDQDLHGIYFSGNTFTSLGARGDTIALFPHISQTLLMTPDSLGKLWIFSISLNTSRI